MSQTALEILSDLKDNAVRQKYPTVPAHAVPRSRYNDKTANALTTAIISFITLSGGYAVRVNTQGQYNTKLGKWTKSTTTVGTPDILGTINGRTISIEVKVGKDKLSEAQIKQGEAITKAGGLYYVARNFEEFYRWWCETIDNKKSEA